MSVDCHITHDEHRDANKANKLKAKVNTKDGKATAKVETSSLQTMAKAKASVLMTRPKPQPSRPRLKPALL